jgi:citrate lyase subunit beta/citryl-CoA lyase
MLHGDVTMIHRPRRSALFMPAGNARAVDKARTLACDVVILDLEDAVAPSAKDAAREAMVAAVAAGGFGSRELVVRVNAASTPWGQVDLAAVAAARPNAVLLPKVDDAGAIADARRVTGDLPLWAMIETARGIVNLPAIAAAPGLAVLVAGTNDLARDLRVTPGAERLPLLAHLSAIIAAARAFGLVALDGVHNAIDDGGGLAAECAQGLAWGFDGKSLIHPKQIAACHAAFTPSAEAVARAQALERAWAQAGGDAAGVVQLDGRMVEQLHLDEARGLLARMRAIGNGA